MPAEKNQLTRCCHLQGISIFSGKSQSVTVRNWTCVEQEVLNRLLPDELKVLQGCKGRFFVQKSKKAPLEYLPAHLDYVVDTSRRTTVLGLANKGFLVGAPVQEKQAFSVAMVEHLLAALEAENITNVIIEVEQEIPMLDGSSQAWCDVFKTAKIGAITNNHSIMNTIRCDQGKHLSFQHGSSLYLLLPLAQNEKKWSVMIDFPNEPLIQTQAFTVEESLGFTEKFREEIAPARSFCSKSELDLLHAKGLILAGGYENGLVYHRERVLTPGGLRFSNEMARHKILDMIGDFSLFPFQVVGHIIAIKPSHAGNIAFGHFLAAI